MAADRCPFCLAPHTLDDCPNIDPEQYAEEKARQANEATNQQFARAGEPPYTLTDFAADLRAITEPIIDTTGNPARKKEQS